MADWDFNMLECSVAMLFGGVAVSAVLLSLTALTYVIMGCP